MTAPPAGWPADLERRCVEAAYAPFAAFLLVAGAEGQLDGARTERYVRALALARAPALRQILAGVPVPESERLAGFVDNEALLATSLLAAGEIFARAPGGAEARAELLSILRAAVTTPESAGVEAHIGPAELAALGRVESLLDAGARGRATILPAVAMLVAGVGAWQLVATWLGWTAAFVPVAVVLQIVALAYALWSSHDRSRYPGQVVRGTLVSVLGAAGIGLTSIAIGFGLGRADTVLADALAGAAGTVVTGFVTSIVLGALLRRV